MYAASMTLAEALVQLSNIIRFSIAPGSGIWLGIYGFCYCIGLVTHFIFQTYILELLSRHHNVVRARLFVFLRYTVVALGICCSISFIFTWYLEDYATSPYWYRAYTTFFIVLIMAYIFTYQILHNIFVIYFLFRMIRTKRENVHDSDIIDHLFKLVSVMIALDLIATCFMITGFLFIEKDAHFFEHMIFLGTGVPCLHLMLTVIFYTEMIKVQFSQELRVKNQDYHKTNVKGNKRPKVVELKGHDTINAHSIKHDVSTVKMR